MSENITFVENDRRPSIVIGLKNILSIPIDVSAETTTVTFYFRKIDAHGEPKYGSIVLSKHTDGSDGKVLLEWGENDLDSPGKYIAEIEIDYDGLRHTVPFLIYYTVRGILSS